MRHVWVAAAAWLLICAGGAAGEGDEAKLLLVVLDKVTWHDVLSDEANTPTLDRLAGEGAVGMMCVRAGRGFAGGYATIGAGSRAAARRVGRTEVSIEALALEVDERWQGVPAARAYRAHTAWLPGDSAIVHLGIGELIRQNQATHYPLHLGLLGGTMRRSGLKIACVGNADVSGELHREAAAIAMDEQGQVDAGTIGPWLRAEDLSLPYRYTTDPGRLAAAVRRAAHAADVVVLELGETARAARAAERMPPRAAAQLRKRALERADRLLAAALDALGEERWEIVVITPTIRTPESGESFAELAPVIWWTPESGPWLLSSPSTRRPGLVVNTDIAPSVLDHLGVATPGEAVGRAMTREPTAEDPLVRLQADLSRHDGLERVRRWVFRWLPAASAVALWVSAFFLLIGERAPRVLRTLLRGLLLVLLSAPAAMLLVGVRPLSEGALVVAIVGGSVAIALVGGWLTGWRSGHVLPALLVVGLLAYDLVRGQGMLYWSPLGYSPAAGARFYGIGNEYAGVLMGAALLMVAGLLSSRPRCGWGERVFMGTALFALAALVGLPRFGANLGMSLAFVAAAAVFVLYLWREQVRWTDVLAALLVALGVMGAAIVVDVGALGPGTSHIGRWIEHVREVGWQAVGDVIQRKLSMNWLLLRVSSWAGAAIAALAVFAVVIAARPARVRAVLSDRTWVEPGVIASVAGAAAALALNDSGIVSAALVLLYAAGSLCYLSLGDVGLEN